jgi:protein subunit release factor B
MLDKLEITHRHARGPGGQHVNKSEKQILFFFFI